VLALLGRRAWWLPKWLDRALPNVDVEGEGLKDLGDGDAKGKGADEDEDRELVRA